MTVSGEKIGVNSYDLTQKQIFRNEINKIEKPGTIAGSHGFGAVAVIYEEGQVLCQDPTDPDGVYFKYASPVPFVETFMAMKAEVTRKAKTSTLVPDTEVIAVGDGIATHIYWIASMYSLKPGSMIITAIYTPGNILAERHASYEKFKAAVAAGKIEGRAVDDFVNPLTMTLYDLGNGVLHGAYGDGVIDYYHGWGHMNFEFPPDAGGGLVVLKADSKPVKGTKKASPFTGKTLVAGDILGSYDYFESQLEGADNPCAINKLEVTTPVDENLSTMVFTSGNFRAPKLIPADIWTADDYARIKLAEHDVILHNM